ncbi:hypothetical protein BDY24DRAFT_386514 [Mrakia frigida]|uniref:vacuolar protein sorting family 37 protein n=1 Tax=Mrakia frigida TaxID=29902 RepID=UPI003FCBFE73
MQTSSQPTASTSALFQTFPQTQSLSRDDLHDLLTDEQYHQAFVSTLPAIKDKLDEIDQIERTNEELAERNLALQPALAQLRSETLAAFNHANELKARWKDIEKEQASLYQRNSPAFLHLRLRHSLAQQDDLSESIANAFIEGSRADTPSLEAMGGNGGGGDKSSKALEDFVRDFKAARKVYHKRALWSERWGRGEVVWRED